VFLYMYLGTDVYAFWCRSPTLTVNAPVIGSESPGVLGRELKAGGGLRTWLDHQRHKATVEIEIASHTTIRAQQQRRQKQPGRSEEPVRHEELRSRMFDAISEAVAWRRPGADWYTPFTAVQRRDQFAALVEYKCQPATYSIFHIEL
jgi:hypothetical protein